MNHILELFERQISEGMTFLGADSIHELDPSFLSIPASWDRWSGQDQVSSVG